MTFTARITPYKIYEKSWTTAPTNLALGVADDGIANAFTIINGPGDLAIRLNSTANDLIEYAEGLDGVAPFNEIYITSAQVSGSCKIYVAWEGP